MPPKNKYTRKITPVKHAQVFNYWMANPNTTNAQLAHKFNLTARYITIILTQGLQQCKQK